jgi:hypothetical protein
MLVIVLKCKLNMTVWQVGPGEHQLADKLPNKDPRTASAIEEHFKRALNE